jgi:hypothetical protein
MVFPSAFNPQKGTAGWKKWKLEEMKEKQENKETQLRIEYKV